MTEVIDIDRRKDAMLKAATHIAPELLALESTLLISKWPAYRFLSPWDATMPYAEVYRTHFSATFGMSAEFDVEPGTEAFATLWRMRQAADRWAMPYREFLRIAFTMNRRDQLPFIAPHERFSNLLENRNFLRKVWKSRDWLQDMAFDDMGPQYWVDLTRQPSADGQLKLYSVYRPCGQHPVYCHHAPRLISFRLF